MPRKALSEDEVLTRRAEILDVAEALHESQGLEAVSLRRIAARAGCSATTPYRYFPSKEHVLLGLRVRAYDAVRDALEASAALETGPAGRLRTSEHGRRGQLGGAHTRNPEEHEHEHAARHPVRTRKAPPDQELRGWQLPS